MVIIGYQESQPVIVRFYTDEKTAWRRMKEDQALRYSFNNEFDEVLVYQMPSAYVSRDNQPIEGGFRISSPGRSFKEWQAEKRLEELENAHN